MLRVLHFLARIILISAFAVLAEGCFKLSPRNNIPVSMVGVIPKGFDWKTVRELSCTVRVSTISGTSDNAVRIVRIYNSPLMEDGSLIASGSALPSSPLVLRISLPKALPTIYIQVILPDETRKSKSVDISGTTLNVSFSPSDISSSPNSAESLLTTKASASPSIPIPSTDGDYDEIITNQSGLTLLGFASGQSSSHGNTYKSYLIPSGTTRTKVLGTSNWQSHAILYVKGVYKYTLATDLSKVSIVVLNGGRVELSSLTAGYSPDDVVTIYVASGGTLVTSGGISITNGRYVVNKGSFTVGASFNVAMGTDVYNEGSMTVTNSLKNTKFNFSNSSLLYNNSSIDCDQIYLDSGSSVLNESGTIRTIKWYQTTGTTTNNHGHIVATTSFTTQGDAVVNNFCNINSSSATILDGSTFNLYSGSILKCLSLKPTNLTMNMEGGSMFLGETITDIWKMKVISTSDSYALFKCTGDVASFLYTSSEFNGKIEFVHSKLVEGSGTNGRALYESFFNNNGSILSKTQTKNIIGTTCNDSEGTITISPPVFTDIDGDGVAAGTDIDDNDATVAYVSYFPNASTWGTYAFEDLWPAKGDYDVNDMILGFRLAYYSNAANKVTKLQMDYNMRAAGSVYNLGVAFQLDKIQASNIISVSGQALSGTSPFAVNANGTESGVALAVIPLFNNQRHVISYTGFLNTENGNYMITPDKSVTVKFNSPVEQSDVTMDAFNMFIVADSRGNEIHLPSYRATSKFDILLTLGWSLYPGDYFKNADGMMWGLMVPETFRYPAELNSIATTYLHFGEWATSGGASYPDWYKPLNGYTNEALIFQN